MLLNLQELLKVLLMFLNQWSLLRLLIQQQHKLRPLISQVIINRIDVIASTVSVTNNPLASLTDEDLALLGQLLAPLLVSESTSVSAVDEWIQRYPALGEFDAAHAWFRPLVYEIAKKLKANVSWGANRRLYVGASLSVLDMVSDIYMIVEYWNTPGKKNTAVALLTCLLMNLAAQLLIVIGQNMKAPRRVLFREMLYVLSCTKVGVDVYRVAVGAKQETYQAASADTELGEYSDNLLQGQSNLLSLFTSHANTSSVPCSILFLRHLLQLRQELEK